MKTINLEPELLIDSHHGIYIPQLFAKTFNFPENFINYDEVKENLNLLANDNSHEQENYFDIWVNVVDNAKIKFPDGQTGYIYENNDLWAVPDRYENNDFFNN